MVAKTDTRPYKDPRNAVGLLTDVFDLALVARAPEIAAFKPPPLFADLWKDLSCYAEARDVGRSFAKASVEAFSGARRKGTAPLYQRAKSIRYPIDVYRLSNATQELLHKLNDLVIPIKNIITGVMEDAHGWRDPSENKYWIELWKTYVPNALALGADGAGIAHREAHWRWRDVTDRKHRGLSMRAAFEAAWMAGQHDFAMKLVKGL